MTSQMNNFLHQSQLNHLFMMFDLKQKLIENYKNFEKNHSEIFRYKLKFEREKVLSGNFQFFIQVRIVNFHFTRSINRCNF